MRSIMFGEPIFPKPLTEERVRRRVENVRRALEDSRRVSTFFHGLRFNFYTAHAKTYRYITLEHTIPGGTEISLRATPETLFEKTLELLQIAGIRIEDGEALCEGA